MEELVNHPLHYQSEGMECIEAMLLRYGRQQVAQFCEINAFKYLWRAGSKEGNTAEQDEAKARWYLTKMYDIDTEDLKDAIRGYINDKNRTDTVNKNIEYLKEKIRSYKRMNKLNKYEDNEDE